VTIVEILMRLLPKRERVDLASMTDAERREWRDNELQRFLDGRPILPEARES